eukprot:sb/3467953/
MGRNNKRKQHKPANSDRLERRVAFAEENFKKHESEFETFLADYQFPPDLPAPGKQALITKFRSSFFEKALRKLNAAKLKRDGVDNMPAKRARINPADSTNKQRIVIDFSNNTGEVDKLAKLISECHRLNIRVSEEPFQLQFVNPSDQLQSKLKAGGFGAWGCQAMSVDVPSLSDLFPIQDIVYLCADSENVISELDESKVYVIGGFINQSENGVKRAGGYNHARLPIVEKGDNIGMVEMFQIIMNCREIGNMKEAVKFVVHPPRTKLSDEGDGEASGS